MEVKAGDAAVSYRWKAGAVVGVAWRRLYQTRSQRLVGMGLVGVGPSNVSLCQLMALSCLRECGPDARHSAVPSICHVSGSAVSWPVIQYCVVRERS